MKLLIIRLVKLLSWHLDGIWCLFTVTETIPLYKKKVPMVKHYKSAGKKTFPTWRSQCSRSSWGTTEVVTDSSVCSTQRAFGYAHWRPPPLQAPRRRWTLRRSFSWPSHLHLPFSHLFMWCTLGPLDGNAAFVAPIGSLHRSLALLLFSRLANISSPHAIYWYDHVLSYF